MAAVTYGIMAGRVIHASEAIPGVACGCLCPGCGNALSARVVSGRRPHFVHAGVPACSSATTEGFRRAAVQGFTDLLRLRLPSLALHGFVGDLPVTASRPTERDQGFDSVAVDVPVGGLVAHAVGHRRSRMLAVMFQTRLPAGIDAIEAARTAGVAALEIDIRDAGLVEADGFPAWATLTAPRAWLWHPWTECLNRELQGTPRGDDTPEPRASHENQVFTFI